MKLRIAMLGACPYPVPQGSQVFLRENALALQRAGHDVRLVVYHHGLGEEPAALPIDRAAAVPFAKRTAAGPSFAKPLQDLALLAALRRVLHRDRIQLVCAHNYEALLVALASGFRPILYHAHNAMSDELPHYFGGRGAAERFGRWLDRTFPKRADCVVTPHRRLAGHLIVRGCDHAKVRIVAPPVDLAAFEETKPGKSVPPVVYAGNLDLYQNLGLLFAAMTRLRARLPEARLRIVTADDAETRDAEIVPAPDFAALLQVLRGDCVCAVPRISWSGYPIKILNAMAAGRGIVACRGAAWPITHEHDGLIVPDNDEAAFADALHRLLTDHRLRAELGRNARETIARHHNPDSIAAQLSAIALEITGFAAEAAAATDSE
jgi:glycosyltransferase involved in cell wall biosynthesis